MNFLKYKSNRYTVKEIKGFKPLGIIFLETQRAQKIFFKPVGDKIFFLLIQKEIVFVELTNNLQITRSFNGFGRISHSSFIFHPKQGPIRTPQTDFSSSSRSSAPLFSTEREQIISINAPHLVPWSILPDASNFLASREQFELADQPFR